MPRGRKKTSQNDDVDITTHGIAGKRCRGSRSSRRSGDSSRNAKRQDEFDDEPPKKRPRRNANTNKNKNKNKSTDSDSDNNSGCDNDDNNDNDSDEWDDFTGEIVSYIFLK